MLKRLKKLWRSIRLLKRAEVAFTMASKGEDESALGYLVETEKALGPVTQYTFGIEPILLKIYLRGSLGGIKADDFDWAALQECIISASEYNASEKLHLMAYLEELATTAGVSLPMSDLLSAPAPREPVRAQLIARFPKLSEA